MNKNEFNIKPPNNWIYWLSTFRIGEEQEVGIEDIKSIRVSIAQTFHRNKIAKFTTKQNKLDTNRIIIRRIK